MIYVEMWFNLWVDRSVEQESLFGLVAVLCDATWDFLDTCLDILLKIAALAGLALLAATKGELLIIQVPLD